MKKVLLPALAILVCAASIAAAAETTLSKSTLFVDAEWLKSNLANVTIVDARPAEMYKKGHIPGAVNAEWTYFANMKGQPGNPGWGEIFEKDKLAGKIGALGISGKKPVIVYADGGWGQDGWVSWILRLSGVADARQLDGGFNAWLAAGGKPSTTPTKAKAVAFSIASFQGGYKVTTPWLNSKLGEVTIVDARTPFEYEGGRLFQERRGGHIPGAINIPFDVVFKKDDMTVKEIKDLQAIFSMYGLDPEQEIIVYDTAGVRAAHLVMVLRMAGYEKARNFDSSFQEWAGNMELEVVQGKDPGGPPKQELAIEETSSPVDPAPQKTT